VTLLQVDLKLTSVCVLPGQSFVSFGIHLSLKSFVKREGSC